MKYTILGLCQKTLCELNLTINDAMIYSYILDFAPQMKSILIDDEQYFWVDYGYFIKNLPILNSGKNTNSDRELKKRISQPLDRLHEAGVIKKYVKRVASGSYIYVAIDKTIHQRLKGLEGPRPAPIKQNPKMGEAPIPQNPKTGYACKTQKRVMQYKDDSSINHSSISQSPPEAKKPEQQKTSDQKTDGRTDDQTNLIQSYVLRGYPREYVLMQIEKFKQERQRRANKGLSPIANSKVYLDKMITDTDAFDVFMAEREIEKNKPKQIVRGYQTVSEVAQDLSEEDQHKQKIRNEEYTRQNDSEFQEMLKNPDGDLYKKCIDSLAPFVRKNLRAENTLFKISMYAAFKRLNCRL